MHHVWKKLSALSLFAVSLVVWGCEGLGDSNKVLGPDGEAREAITIVTGSGYTIIKENDGSIGVVTGIIDQNGGRMSLGQHQLDVPAGAVEGPTTFSMTRVDGDQVRVKLTATQVTTNDVGSAGFKVPVQLRLSYKNATELEKPESELRVIWIRLDGSVEVQSSTVDVTGKHVTAPLDHFSDYALAFPM